MDADISAATLAREFRAYRTAFEDITAKAKERFEQSRWLDVQEAGSARLSLYKEHISMAVAQFANAGSPIDWPALKRAYHERTKHWPDAELAETYYNSVYREATNDQAVNDEEMFIASLVAPPDAVTHITRRFEPATGVVDMVRDIITFFDFSLPWRNLDQDIGNILRSLAEERPEIVRSEALSVDIITSVFYRNKGAYLVGLIRYEDLTWPVALPVLNDDGRLYIDTLICDEDEMSVMFSFTRTYFMVATPYPRALVRLLHELLPNKKISELYASIGLFKHGKTEFYRGFVEHLNNSDDAFIIAPGIKGMVMSVFLLPSYQTVFKVIKDRFPPQKNTTHEEVRTKYNIVKSHDRVGRMADTQEFQNFSFPRHRFSQALIDELSAVAPNAMSIEGDRIVIRHLYVERQMTPLNMFVDNADEADLRSALDEYGNAIKQLAAANIFPGDMLLKNFGITRHGRVVFYDYDEICYLTDVNFRAIPEPRTPEEEMSGDIWYSVAPNDVFPEEFRRFLFGKRHIKQLFNDMHGDLFDPAFWRKLQDNLQQGYVTDVFPYRRKKRFKRMQKRV